MTGIVFTEIMGIQVGHAQNFEALILLLLTRKIVHVEDNYLDKNIGVAMI